MEGVGAAARSVGALTILDTVTSLSGTFDLNRYLSSGLWNNPAGVPIHLDQWQVDAAYR